LPDGPPLQRPYLHELIGGDKNGTIYVVNGDAMGKFNRSLDQIIQELPGGVGVHHIYIPYLRD
jgi:hypothetical protein